MPSLVNRVPQGLLDLLGIKALGLNPAVFPDTLQAVLDLEYFYLNVDNSYRTGVFSAGPGAASIGLAGPPPGFIWIISDVFARCTTQAVEAADWYLSRSMPIEPTRPFAISNDVSQGASLVRNVTVRGPIWLDHGESLGLQVSASTGTVDFAYAYRIKELRV